MPYKLQDLVDIPQLQELTDHLYQAARIPSAIITMDGEILTGSGWQRVCTDFHRKNPEIEKACIQSDIAIRKKIDDGDPFAMYTCPRGLTDASIPIVIEGEHLANAFAGQLFLEPPDQKIEAFFRESAREFGMDEEAYMAAFREIPVLPLDRFRPALMFLAKLAAVIAGIGLQRKRELEAAARLRNSEERYRLLFEQAGDYVILFEMGESGMPVITDLSDAVVSAHGYTRDELLGRPISFLDPDVTPETNAKRMRDMAKNGKAFFSVKHRRKDGSMFDAEVTAVTVSIGGKDVILTVERDVTDKKKAEQERLKFQLGIERSSEAIFITALDGTIEYVNQAFEDLYGFEKAEVIGKTPRVLKSGTLDNEIYVSFWNRILSNQIAKGEIVNKAKDGRLLVIDSTVNPFLDENGAVLGFLAIQRDVTERKRAEEDRKKLESQLQQTMKMEAVGRLAGGVAHDFNNLLTVINGQCEMIIQDLHAGDPLRADVSEIKTAGERAAALTAQLLAFSRRQIIDPKVIDLNRLLSDSTKMIKRLIGEDIELVFVPDKDLGSVRVDPHQIEQVLVNLAVNARDAMPDGGRLAVETSNVCIDDEFASTHLDAEQGDYVLLSVSDNGLGMAPDVVEHLFEPFFTTKEKGKGTGLGLSMIYGTVRQIGGFINVYSEVGIGTTFNVYLPLVSGKADAFVRPKMESLPRGAETILLVEDEEKVRNLALKLLKRQGYNVLTAENGEKAFSLASCHDIAIDLLLTDVIMPGINGRKLFEKIRPMRPGLRVLYMSGYTEDAIAHHGVLEEGTNFIQKPFSIADLVFKVREVLDRM